MLRHMNLSEKEKRILRYVFCFGSTSRQQLSHRARYTSPTVYRVIEDLMRQGLVVISGVEEEAVKGRPTERVEVNGAKGWVFCLSIFRGGYHTAVVDLAGRLLGNRWYPFDAPTQPQQVVEQAFTDRQNMMETHGLSLDGMLGVGLATVGPIDYQRGWMKAPIHFAGGDWKDVPIADMLAKRLQGPVSYDCIAGACLMGRYLPGYFGVYENMAYITMGSGVGSGLILNGSLHSHQKVILDGLAHMTIELNGRPCNCGAYGCVETYVSRSAIVGDCLRSLKLGRPSWMIPHMDHLDISHVALALAQKDPLAEHVLREAAAVMACCLSNYLRMVFLDAVVIGGPLIEELPPFFGYIQEALSARGGAPIVLLRGEREDENVLRGIAAQRLLAGPFK